MSFKNNSREVIGSSFSTEGYTLNKLFIFKDELYVAGIQQLIHLLKFVNGKRQAVGFEPNRNNYEILDLIEYKGELYLGMEYEMFKYGGITFTNVVSFKFSSDRPTSYYLGFGSFAVVNDILYSSCYSLPYSPNMSTTHVAKWIGRYFESIGQYKELTALI